jgi:hypothetical protein
MAIGDAGTGKLHNVTQTQQIEQLAAIGDSLSVHL